MHRNKQFPELGPKEKLDAAIATRWMNGLL
jgi:hypothetical protein